MQHLQDPFSVVSPAQQMLEEVCPPSNHFAMCVYVNRAMVCLQHRLGEVFGAEVGTGQKLSQVMSLPGTVTEALIL